MGRSAGHLAFGIASACHFPMMIIPEMFNKTKLYDNGVSGCIVSANSRGDITPLYLKDFQDENGKVQPRLVDIESDMAQLFINNLIYIREKDYESAK
ncbi:hypothetical protein [Lutibacter sp. HS1-25]|uniref:hypothetical protein n=1 Tax=Lutibacter sp. HS1-25 TaxID=2485000 RepID=UPI001F0C0ABB|nr:hypothetical protein [Lutibacter sp. HS1-25]